MSWTDRKSCASQYMDYRYDYSIDNKGIMTINKVQVIQRDKSKIGWDSSPTYLWINNKKYSDQSSTYGEKSFAEACGSQNGLAWTWSSPGNTVVAWKNLNAKINPSEITQVVTNGTVELQYTYNWHMSLEIPGVGWETIKFEENGSLSSNIKFTLPTITGTLERKEKATKQLFFSSQLNYVSNDGPKFGILGVLRYKKTGETVGWISKYHDEAIGNNVTFSNSENIDNKISGYFTALKPSSLYEVTYYIVDYLGIQYDENNNIKHYGEVCICECKTLGFYRWQEVTKNGKTTLQWVPGNLGYYDANGNWHMYE